MFNVLAIIFWWFYIIVCPVSTLVVLFISVKLDKAGHVDIYRAVGCTSLLVLVLGTATTAVGPMSWWVANVVGDKQANGYYVWHYAIACIIVQACVILVKLLSFKKSYRNAVSR